MPKSHSPEGAAPPAQEDVQETRESAAEGGERKKSFGERLSSLKNEMKAGLEKYFLGRFSKEELAKQQSLEDAKGDLKDLQEHASDLEVQLAKEEDPERRQILENKLEMTQEVIKDEKDKLSTLQGGAIRNLTKGLAKAALSTAATLTGVKFFPEAIRYGLQKREVKKERARIKEVLEGTEDKETIKTDFGLRHEALVERVKESRHLSVEKRNQLLARLEAVKAEREKKLLAAENQLMDSVEGEERSPEDDIPVTVDVSDEEREAIDAETMEKMRIAIDQHVETQVKGVTVAKEFINTAAAAAGLGVLRTVGYAGASLVERYQRIKGERAKEQGIDEREAKAGVMKDVFMDGFTETMKGLALGAGGKTKAERAARFAKALGTVARAAGFAGIAGGELMNEGVSKAIERSMSGFQEAWSESDGPIDTMRNVAEQMVGNVGHNLENMAGFYKKVFSGELWNSVMAKVGGGEVEAGTGGAAAGAMETAPHSAVDVGPEQAGGAVVEGGELETFEVSKEALGMATIHKGEGITHSLVRQLEADPEKFGFKGSAKEMHRWALKMSKDIATHEGYIKPDGSEVRISFDKGEAPAFVLRPDGTVMEVGVDDDMKHLWKKAAKAVETVAADAAPEAPPYPADADAAVDAMERGQNTEAIDAEIAKRFGAAGATAAEIAETRAVVLQDLRALQWATKAKELEMLTDMGADGTITERDAATLRKLLESGDFKGADRKLLEELANTRRPTQDQLNQLSGIRSGLHFRAGQMAGRVGSKFDHLLKSDLDRLHNQREAIYNEYVKERPVEVPVDHSTGRKPLVPRSLEGSGAIEQAPAGLNVAELERQAPTYELSMNESAKAALAANEVTISGNAIKLADGQEFAIQDVDGVHTDRIDVRMVPGSGGDEVRISVHNSDGSRDLLHIKDGELVGQPTHVRPEVAAAVEERLKPMGKAIDEIVGAERRPVVPAAEVEAGEAINAGRAVELPPEYESAIAKMPPGMERGMARGALAALIDKKGQLSVDVQTELSAHPEKIAAIAKEWATDKRFEGTTLGQAVLARTMEARLANGAVTEDVLQKAAKLPTMGGRMYRIPMEGGKSYLLDSANGPQAAALALKLKGIPLDSHVPSRTEVNALIEGTPAAGGAAVVEGSTPDRGPTLAEKAAKDFASGQVEMPASFNQNSRQFVESWSKAGIDKAALQQIADAPSVGGSRLRVNIGGKVRIITDLAHAKQAARWMLEHPQK